MPIDQERLAHYLGTAGSHEVDRASTNDDLRLRLAGQLFRREFGRDPGDALHPPLLGLLDVEQPVDDFVATLRSTTEWFAGKFTPLDVQTASFRQLSAHVREAGRDIAPKLIAECIAAFDLVLGREPDIGGFDHFIAVRERQGLLPMIADLMFTDEAERHFAPAAKPPLESVALAVGTTAVGILHAAGVAAALQGLDNLHGAMAQFAEQLDRVARSLDQLATLVRLRFDGEASNQ